MLPDQLLGVRQREESRMTPRFLAQGTRRELALTKGRGQEKLVCRRPSEAQLETILS